jgi:hypothetical protein
VTTIESDADEAAVRRLMAESDLDAGGEDELFAALLDLRGLRSGVIDVPSADVAALMAGRRRRRLRTRGAIIVALVAAASVGTGLSAAAAPQLRDSAQKAIAAVIHTVNPFAAPPSHHTPASSPPKAVPARANGTVVSAHPHQAASGPAHTAHGITTGSGATRIGASAHTDATRHGASEDGVHSGSSGHGDGSGRSSERTPAEAGSTGSSDGGGSDSPSGSRHGSDGSRPSPEGGSPDASGRHGSPDGSGRNDASSTAPAGD